jgi:hypothetical protein
MLATKIAASAGVALIVIASAAGCSADDGHTPASLTIDDTAEILNAEKLNDVLGELDFREPTDVAIYTRTGEYSDNINRETLDYAREAHPEWISDDPDDYGDYWTDGLFIITLSVEDDGHGQIGTYFGEDRAVSEGRMEKMHAAGTDNFRQARWTDGVIDVAESGAELIGAPPISAGGWAAIGIGGAGGAGAVTGITLAVRRSRREAFATALDKGSEHLTQVAMDLQETEIAATTFPAGSRYAAELEKKFNEFLDLYKSSDAERDELRGLDKKQRAKTANVDRAKAFQKNARKLDAVDDAISAASALYRRSPAWENAWSAQTKPLLDDLTALPSLVEDSTGDLAAPAAALTSYGQQARADVESLGADLATEAVTVDDALDRLSEMRAELTSKLEAFSEAQIAAFAKDESEADEMREEMRKSRRGSVRAGGSILDLTYGYSYFWHVADYHAGYRAGTQSVESSRASASSSSGISGSGGSSRF